MAAPAVPASKPKVIYFNYDGGRGEGIRLAFHISGVDFIDERVDFAQWPSRKPSTPYGTLPLLEWDGVVMAQSNSIMRFLGRQFNLYPTDLLLAQRADEVMDAAEEIGTKFIPTMSMPAGPEKLAKRKEITEGPMKVFLSHWEAILKKGPGPFFTGPTLTVADLKVLGFLRWITSGTLDGVDANCLEPYPALVAFKDAMEAHPQIRDWTLKHPPVALPRK